MKKNCRKCGEPKEISFFSPGEWKKDKPLCRACMSVGSIPRSVRGRTFKATMGTLLDRPNTPEEFERNKAEAAQRAREFSR